MDYNDYLDDDAQSGFSIDLEDDDFQEDEGESDTKKKTTPEYPTYKRHPLSAIWPSIQGTEYMELVEDIRKNGVIEPIIMLDGMILDGWNRYNAAKDSGRLGTLVTEKYDEELHGD